MYGIGFYSRREWTPETKNFGILWTATWRKSNKVGCKKAITAQLNHHCVSRRSSSGSKWPVYDSKAHRKLICLLFWRLSQIIVEWRRCNYYLSPRIWTLILRKNDGDNWSATDRFQRSLHYQRRCCETHPDCIFSMFVKSWRFVGNLLLRVICTRGKAKKISVKNKRRWMSFDTVIVFFAILCSFENGRSKNGAIKTSQLVKLIELPLWEVRSLRKLGQTTRRIKSTFSSRAIHFYMCWLSSSALWLYKLNSRFFEPTPTTVSTKEFFCGPVSLYFQPFTRHSKCSAYTQMSVVYRPLEFTAHVD